jgi:protocatechuate 3,4-dioxygenase beta subunit
MRMSPDRNRRRLLAALGGMLVATPVLSGSRLLPTPAQSAGPFYPLELPLDDDNDLTRVAGRDGVAAGRLTELSGRLLDLNGRPLADARIEIWQCDANGRYRHPGDRRRVAPDENFQGHGRTVTDSAGRYRFRTIRPVPYPGRTPHIHIAVSAPQSSPLVTQLYIRGEPGNTGDFLFNRIPAERAHLVQADFVAATMLGVELQAEFDMVLGGSDGTPAV